MNIETKNWSARYFVASTNYTSGISVSGSVTVPSSNFVPILVPVGQAGPSNHASLTLKLVSDGIGLSVLTDKTVAYALDKASPGTVAVDIYYNDEQIASIPVIR